jgi:protein ImuB
MKRYAVLYAPEFRLQSLLRYAPERRLQCVALVEREGSQSRVSERNEAARAGHVQVGMTPTQAMARCPGLHFLQGNAGHERSAQEILLQMAENLSPHLEPTQGGIVTVELPPERKFQERELVEKIVAPLQAVGLEVRVGLAATPDLALLAARLGRPVKIVMEPASFLAPLPLEALEPSGELGFVLESWGIRTVGQLVALPREEVCGRLGPEAAALWERATGGRPRPLQGVKPQESFSEQADLEHPVEMLEPLLFLLRRFLDQIAARLAQAHFVAGRLRLVLRFENDTYYRRVFTLPQPTREVNVLFRMLHTHLENYSSEAPIVGLELAAQPVRPQAEQFGLLEKGLRDPHQFAETLARLEGLLGHDRVGRAELESSHHPDAFRLRPYEAALPVAPEEAELPAGIPWLRFRPPEHARIIRNGAWPAFLYSSRHTGPIKEARGPWLLEGDWWEADGWSREEWDIATEEGVYRLVRREEEWFLDGIYA